MFAKLGSLIYKRRWVVLLLGLLFMAASGLLGAEVFGNLKGGGYTNPGAESTQVADSIKQQLGGDSSSLIVLFTSQNGWKVDDPAYKVAVQDTLSRLDGQPDVGKITTYYGTGAAALVSNDRLSTYALVGLNGSPDSQLKMMDNLRALLTSDKLQVRLGGEAAVSQDITKIVQKDLENAELFSFPVTFVLLIIIFGSLLAASLPLFIGGFAILGAILILRVTANYADVSTFAVNIVTMLGLGLAIDYSLFVVSRFREELARSEGDVGTALARTMQTAGRTVIFSGFTVMISLLSLLLFPQMFLKSMGWGGASAVLVAMLAAVTVLPAALALLGPRINSLSVRSLLPHRFRPAKYKPSESPQRGFWYRISTFVMRHPVVVLVVAIVPLLIAGLPFLSINLSIPDQRALPESAQGRQVGDALMNDFPANETQPIQIAVKSDKPALDPATIGALYAYTRQLRQVQGVQRIESLVTLDPRLDAGGVAAYQAFYGAMNNPQNPQAATAQKAAQQYSNGNFTLVNVLYSSDPLSSQSQTLVKAIRAMQPPQGLSVQVGGRTAELIDFLSSLEASVPVALGLIVGVMFVLLFLMLGSLVVPLKAVALNILSLSASFGALVWIFQDGNLAGLLNFTPIGSIDGTMPVLIFAIAFGLSMDYEVFLLSRIKENYDRTGDTTQSVALGIQKTGSIITSAALLLVVVIGAFAMGQVLFMKQVAVGLGLAILVDATLVRTLLVPATMRLLGNVNWWAPSPLAALYRKLGFAETEREPSAHVPAAPKSRANEAEPA